MIELYEGRLGGGKTYSAVVRMVDHLRRGGMVCTNVDLVWPAIVAYCEKHFRVVLEDDQLIYLAPDKIGLFHRFTPSGTAALPVLVVIDEAHLVFNARDFAQTDKLYRETLTFLTQSRKVATDVIFIAQSVLNMDKQFMRLVQFIWRFRDLARWKIPGLGLRWPLKQILAVQFDYDGRTILQRWFIKKDRAVFALYHTDHIVKPFPRLEVASTARSLRKSEPEKGKMVKILIPLAIIVGVVATWWLVHSFKTAPGGQRNVTTSQPASTVPLAESVRHEADHERGLYDIYKESFVAWNGPGRSMQTRENGWYQVGEMSVRGYVTAVSERRAKVFQPNGRDAWVVATSDAEPMELKAAPSPMPGKPVGTITVATQTVAIPISSPISEPSPTGSVFPISKQR